MESFFILFIGDNMGEFVLNLIAKYGYFGMFLGMILEAVIIIIPSELILATGGILASKGVFSLFWVFIIGLLGSVFCAVILYIMGYFGGRKFVEKYGKYFFMKDSDIEKSERTFNKYGGLACFIGRNFPIVRTLISIPAGIYKYNFINFLLYTTFGSIPWTFIFTYVGYRLGKNWVLMNGYTNKLKIVIYILILIIIIKYLYSKIKIWYNVNR